MSIIKRIDQALETLRAHDKPKRDRLLSKACLTPDEEDWIDNQSNYTELAQLLEDLKSAADPEAEYSRRKQAGLTILADATMKNASDLIDELRPSTPQPCTSSTANNISSPNLRRSPREFRSPKSPWESVAIPAAPANPSGLPGHRGYHLLFPATQTDSKQKTSTKNTKCLSRKKPPRSEDLAILTPASSRRRLTSSSSLQSQMSVTDVSDNEDVSPSQGLRRQYMVFSKQEGTTYKCLLCWGKYTGVSTM